MKRGAALILGCLALGGCNEQRTGLHVTARVSGLQYDELRFGVAIIATPSAADAGDQVVVDPAADGRYVGPFTSGDQDVFIYVSDDFAGDVVRCEVTALRTASPIATGAANVTLARHAIKDVEVVLLAPGAGGSGGQAGGAGGAAGEAGTTGAAGDGAQGGNGGQSGQSGQAGQSGQGGQGGQGGTTPPKKAANGSVCAADMDCMSSHCVAGLCCDSGCDMPCKSCALSGTEGVCSPVAEGTTCSAASCADAKNLVPAGTCTATGMCMVPKKIMCVAGCVAGLCL